MGYILFEVPWNLVLRKVSPKIWLPTITLVWGVIATLFGVTQNLAGFFVARFFLGVAEGGLFPGVVFYLSCWYRRQERQYRIALFFSGASLAGAFGGILAFVSPRRTSPIRTLNDHNSPHPLGHRTHGRRGRPRRLALDLHHRRSLDLRSRSSSLLLRIELPGHIRFPHPQ